MQVVCNIVASQHHYFEQSLRPSLFCFSNVEQDSACRGLAGALLLQEIEKHEHAAGFVLRHLIDGIPGFTQG